MYIVKKRNISSIIPENALQNIKRKKIELSLTSMLHYLYSRELLKDSWSGTMKEIKMETLEKATKEWRYGNLAMKAVTALVMLHDEKYKNEAYTIMESIKEYLNRQHSLFEEAWALILFNQEDPDGETTGKLREMLYLQKILHIMSGCMKKRMAGR